MIQDSSASSPESPPSSSGGARLLLPSVLLATVAAVLGATLYALGLRGENFRWETFRSGCFLFVLVLSAATVGIVAATLLIRGIAFISPRSLKVISEKRRLKKSQQRTLSTIHRRHELLEEHARLTARMQASFLFEKESAKLAESRAVREFQKALQSGVVRSCEIVFDHLNRTVDQFHQVVDEVSRSALSDSEKSDLLDQLTRQLDVPGTVHRNRSAQKMMEDAVWRVRFRKARLLSRRSPAMACQYLQSLRRPDITHRLLVQIDALLKEFS